MKLDLENKKHRFFLFMPSFVLWLILIVYTAVRIAYDLEIDWIVWPTYVTMATLTTISVMLMLHHNTKKLIKEIREMKA